jgi:hypothetical protein
MNALWWEYFVHGSFAVPNRFCVQLLIVFVFLVNLVKCYPFINLFSNFIK